MRRAPAPLAGLGGSCRQAGGSRGAPTHRPVPERPHNGAITVDRHGIGRCVGLPWSDTVTDADLGNPTSLAWIGLLLNAHAPLVSRCRTYCNKKVSADGSVEAGGGGHGNLLHGWLQNRRGWVGVYLTIGGPPFVDSTTTEHALALTELTYPSVVSPPPGRERPKRSRACSDSSARRSSVRLRWRLRQRRMEPISYSLPST